MLVFRGLCLEDVESLVICLKRQRLIYISGYHPFPFEVDYVKNLVVKAMKDQYIGIFYQKENSICSIIGLLTLRGLDEGYEHPMLGIFISEEYSGKGYAKKAINYAESICSSFGYKGIMMKVSGSNSRALKIYLAQGYQQLDLIDSGTILMGKIL